MGEDDASTEGAKLSGAWKSGGTVCGHNSGESLEWAPKVPRISLMFLSLRPMDRAIAVVPLPFRQGSTYIVFLPTGVFVIPVGF